MSTPSAALHDSPATAQATASPAISPFQQFYWSVQRELWENRSLYLAPLVMAATVLVGFIVSPLGLRNLSAFSGTNVSPSRQTVAAPYDLAAGLIMITAIIVSIFYCLDALYGERRDRSILFWKSLPVSDLTTVLAKASIPLLVLPSVAFVLTVVTQLLMLLLSSAVLLSFRSGVGPLWSLLSPFRMWWMLFYHLFSVHSLWYTPIYAWLLLISAWARRTPLLWAFLPPLAVGIFEKVVFNTSYFARMLGDRFSGGMAGLSPTTSAMPLDPGMHIALGSYLTAPGLWCGLALAALFLVASARLRRLREPI